ncbi:MAG: hypothetical protein RRY34_06030, partial [Victivallaceae bacterium]
MFKKIFIAATLILSVAGGFAAVERPFWRMNLNNVNVGAKYTYLGPNCTVEVEDGQRYLKVKGGGFMTAFGTLGAWNFSDGEIRFEARFYDKIFPINLIIKNRGHRDNVKYDNYVISIMKKQITISPANKLEDKSVTSKAQTIKLTPELEPGKWYNFVVRYQRDKIFISVDNDGMLKEIYQGEILPGGGSIGFDCKRSEVDFRKVEVVELDRNPLPYGERKSSTEKDES